MNLNQEQLERVVEHAQELYSELKKDYAELRLYPVFCRFGPGAGQCTLTTDPLTILVGFPEMIIVSKEVARLGQLLRKEKELSKLKLQLSSGMQPELEALKKAIPMPFQAEYCGDVNVEFRCAILKYKSLRCLQQDPRLPSGLNTVGNIRVIAGSLKYLCRKS